MDVTPFFFVYNRPVFNLSMKLGARPTITPLTINWAVLHALQLQVDVIANTCKVINPFSIASRAIG